MTEKQIATQDWSTRVRILETIVKQSVDPWITRTFHAGEELEMVQWGRAGRPVERDAWWTSFDIDGAHIIEANKVEVLKVLAEVKPEDK